MASITYNIGKKEIFDNSIDMLNDTIKCLLVNSSYTPDKDAHEHYDDITNEVSGTGYTAGGETLTNPAIAVDNANDRAEFDADNVTWSNATLSDVVAAVIYQSTGTSSTSTLIAYVDFGETFAPSNEDLTITWDSEGIIYLGE